MTVLNENAISTYAGNNSATTFDFDFLINAEDELTALRTADDGTQTTLTLNTDYSINETGNESGSYITFPLESSSYGLLQSDENISIFPNLAFTQETAYKNSSALNLENIENSFDYQCRLAQQLKVETDRAVKVPYGSDITADELLEAYQDAAAEITSGFASLTAVDAKVDNLYIVNILDGGAIAGEDITTILTSCLSLGYNIYIPYGEYFITSDFTIPATHKLIFAQGGKLNIASGKTLTYLGVVGADYYQHIFSGSGAVLFYDTDGKAQGHKVSVCWFGADRNTNYSTYTGTVSDTAFLNAVNSISQSGGGCVYIPAGCYRLSASLSIQDAISLKGDGCWNSIIWSSTSNYPLGLLSVIGDSGYPTTIDGIALLGIASTGTGLYIDKNGVNIKDIWINGWGGLNGCGLRVLSTDVQVTNFVIELCHYGLISSSSLDTYINGIVYENQVDVLVNNATYYQRGWTFFNNIRSENSHQTGFNIAGGRNVILDNCSANVMNNTRYSVAGCKIDASNNVIINNFVCETDLCRNTKAPGISVTGSSSEIVINNPIVRNMREGIYISIVNIVTISGGTLNSNLNNGIYANGFGKVNISNINAINNGQANNGYLLSGTYPSTNISSTTLNDWTFKIRVDGSAYSTVTIDPTDKNTSAKIATELQTKIQALGGVFATVTVSYASARYIFASATVNDGSAIYIARTTQDESSSVSVVLKLTGSEGANVVDGATTYNRNAGIYIDNSGGGGVAKVINCNANNYATTIGIQDYGIYVNNVNANGTVHITECQTNRNAIDGIYCTGLGTNLETNNIEQAL